MRGHIRKRGTRWTIVLSLGRDENGKRKQKWYSGYKTKKEAQTALNKMLYELDEGLFAVPGKETVRSYFTKWIEAKEMNVRYNTIKKYRWLTNSYVIPHLGHL